MGILRDLISISAAARLVSAIAILPHDAYIGRRETTPSDPNCNTGPGWASVLTVGATGSDPNDDTYVDWCETQFGHDYTPVTGIEVWQKGDKDGDRVAGLQFIYASGFRSKSYGTEDTSKYPSKTLTLAPGELITSAVLYADGKASYFGHLHIETSKQTFDAGRDTAGITPYPVDVGSGLLLGANIITHNGDKTTGEGDIAALALLFLASPIDHISINNIVFDSDPAGSNSGISPQNVVVGQWFNNAEENVMYSLSPTYGVSSSYSYSQTTSQTFGLSTTVEMSGELFGIGAKADHAFCWDTSSQTATTVATTSSTVIACAASGTVLPSKGIKITGTYQTGNGTFDYSSTVVVSLKDGSSYTYPEKGTLNNVAYNECITTVNDSDDQSNDSVSNIPGFSAITAAPSSTPTSASSQLSRPLAQTSRTAVQTSSSIPASPFGGDRVGAALLDIFGKV